MYADVEPTNATHQEYTWSVVDGTGESTIDQDGLLTAVADGTVTVVATSDEDSTISDQMQITLSNQTDVVVTAVDLGAAGDYAILSKAAISTTAGTYITGDIGLSPASASLITGFGLTMDATGEFSTSDLVSGRVYAADYDEPTPTELTTAVSDMETAYIDAAGRTAQYNELHAGELGGQTLVPGVYKWTTNVLISNDVILDGT